MGAGLWELLARGKIGDLKQKYGLRCILHGMGARWPSEEEKWGFWSRLVHHYCSGYTITPVKQDLEAIIGSRAPCAWPWRMESSMAQRWAVESCGVDNPYASDGYAHAVLEREAGLMIELGWSYRPP